jgi:hypothetical protein
VPRNLPLRRTGCSVRAMARPPRASGPLTVVAGVLERGCAPDHPVLAVLDVQGVAAEPTPMREQHTRGAGRVDRDVGRDRVGAVADVHRDRLRHLFAARIVDIPVARLGELRPLRGQDRYRGPRFERQSIVDARLRPPETLLAYFL